MIFSGLQFLARELLARAEEELYDEDKVHHEMTEAYAALDAGGISEEEFDLREKQLMERLEVIQARREAAGRGDSSGDADDDDDEDDDDDAEEGDDADGGGDAATDVEEEEDEETGSEVHYGLFDDDDDEEEAVAADYDTDVRDRVQAHASRRSP